MPTFNSTRYASQVGAAGASPSAGYPLSEYIAGKLRFAVIPYALAGTEAANDIINIARLKVGAVVLPSYSRIVHEDIGDALTLDVGFASNDDALCDGAALGTNAGDVTFTGAGSVTATAQQYVPTTIAAGDEVIFATVKTATNIVAGKKLLFLLAYLDE